MNPLLAIGQILVSIALIVAILLQARGIGLSGTFGGDSAVYRSRRGVERRLWQFTIILLVLFVVFSPGRLHLRDGHRHRLIGASAAAHRDQSFARSSMTRTDSFVVGTLVVLLAIIAGLVGVPLAASRRVDDRRAERDAGYGRVAGRTARAYSGHPISVSPLSARTQADRDLVALVYLGPGPQRPVRNARARSGRALVGRSDRCRLDLPAP